MHASMVLVRMHIYSLDDPQGEQWDYVEPTCNSGQIRGIFTLPTEAKWDNSLEYRTIYCSDVLFNLF